MSSVPSHVVELLTDTIRKTQTTEDLVSRLRKTINYLAKPRYDEKLITLSDSIHSLLNEKQSTKQIRLSGFSQLTDFFFLTPGLHIIAAPSGHGKTFWAMKWAEAAAKENKQVLVVSLEMSARDLAARKLTEYTSLSLVDVITKNFPDTTRETLASLITHDEQRHLKNIHILSLGDYDWVQIKDRLENTMDRIKPDLIIIDYVQMMYSSELASERQSQVYAEIAREAKLFGDHNDCACLMLSQINRDGTTNIQKAKWKDIGHVPLLNDYVKESGGIVEAADSVQMICVPSKFSFCDYEFRNKFQVSVTKSRRLGVLGTVLFDFDPERMQFK